MRKKTLRAVCSIALLAQIQSFAIGSPTDILIDYGDLALTPTFGGFWNEIPNTSVNGQVLLDTIGAATGVTLSVSVNGNNTFEFNQGAWALGNVDWIDAASTVDVFGFNGASNVTFTFSGLAADQLYRIDHLPARDYDTVADYKINGSFADSTPNGDNWNPLVDGYLGGNYLTWNSIQPNGLGQIQIEITPSVSGEFGYMTASRISIVPEPTTCELALVGLCAAWIHLCKSHRLHRLK